MRRPPDAATADPGQRRRTSRRARLRRHAEWGRHGEPGRRSRAPSVPGHDPGEPTRPTGVPPTTVPWVFHPVGRLPAAVYWRRRLLALGVLLAMLGGTAWLTVTLLDRPDDGAAAGVTAATRAPVGTPALERVLPSLTAVEVPEGSPRTSAAAAPPAAAAAGPTPGGPCTDDMIAVEIRAPDAVASGSKPVVELVVRNTSAVPCTRDLDRELQELVLLDAGGNRIWGSNDCFPEESDERRTLEPGQEATFETVWGGLTSDPACAAERRTVPPGDYVLRGRLDTTTSADRPLRIG
jgi:hypothetical protein